ncbi:MAG TPA: DNA-binding protein, partial [Acidimicrobiales bacterium]|nr:DNA-binding protein [Acidimicrobiales bacterium]
MAGEVLVATNVLEYPYTRTVGPVLGAFFTGLRQGRIQGVRGADGRVLVPPAEYDPLTGEDLSELIDVGQAGVVTTWAWVYAPREKH